MTIKRNKYVAINVLFLLIFNVQSGIMCRHEKPVAEKIWSQFCKENSMILNDCNWCRCRDGRYNCDARVCSEVDMLGHFKDTIREIAVGIEGHGSWRTGEVACSPGVHYQRGDMVCICNEDGAWPNPICRDTLRILHPVELVTNVKNFKDQQCAPAKLYLIGCNICFCPADGVPNSKFCTRNSCSKDDPVFKTPKEKSEIVEVYAECQLNLRYTLGCKNCVCLRNNKLHCNNCTEEAMKGTYCSDKVPGEVFNVDCNTCQCNEQNLMHCTVKRCLKTNITSQDTIDDIDFKSVSAPLNDLECIEDTKYKKGCNTCYCYKRHSMKRFSCTLEKCLGTSSDYINDCVDGSIYELNCLICQCGVYNGKKMQVCMVDPKCNKQVTHKLQQLIDLNGYCEPLHLYKKDCNTCECLPDGKTVRCSASLCQKSPPTTLHLSSSVSMPHISQHSSELKPISVNVVPVVQDIGYCSQGASFKIDCNVCFCLSNGDVICTTEKCKIRNI